MSKRCGADTVGVMVTKHVMFPNMGEVERPDDCYCAAVIPLTCRVCKAVGKVSPADRPPPPPIGHEPREHSAEQHNLTLGQVLEAARLVVSEHDGRCGCCTEGPHCPNCRLGFLLKKLGE